MSLSQVGDIANCGCQIVLDSSHFHPIEMRGSAPLLVALGGLVGQVGSRPHLGGLGRGPTGDDNWPDWPWAHRAGVELRDGAPLRSGGKRALGLPPAEDALYLADSGLPGKKGCHGLEGRFPGEGQEEPATCLDAEGPLLSMVVVDVDTQTAALPTDRPGSPSRASVRAVPAVRPGQESVLGVRRRVELPLRRVSRSTGDAEEMVRRGDCRVSPPGGLGIPTDGDAVVDGSPVDPGGHLDIEDDGESRAAKTPRRESYGEPTGEDFVIGAVCLAGSSCGTVADGDGDGLLRTAERPATSAERWVEDRDGELGAGVAEGGHGVPLGGSVAPPIGDHPLRGPGGAGLFRRQEAGAGDDGLLMTAEGAADEAACWVEDRDDYLGAGVADGGRGAPRGDSEDPCTGDHPPSGPGGKRRGDVIGGERKRIAGAQTHAEDYPD